MNTRRYRASELVYGKPRLEIGKSIDGIFIADYVAPWEYDEAQMPPLEEKKETEDARDTDSPADGE